eukprot:1352850-Amphidinium_carterae.1
MEPTRCIKASHAGWSIIDNVPASTMIVVDTRLESYHWTGNLTSGDIFEWRINGVIPESWAKMSTMLLTALTRGCSRQQGMDWCNSNRVDNLQTDPEMDWKFLFSTTRSCAKN